MEKQKFIPAARFKLLTPMFDLLLSIFGLGKNYRKWVISQFDKELENKSMVLDAGSGTGSIACELKSKNVMINLTAVDIDSKILEIAKNKSRKEKLDINWQETSLTSLPFKDNHFDLVYSSLVIHHLTKAQKIESFKEILRTIKQGESFYLCDIGEAKYSWIPIASWFAAICEEGFENYKGQIPKMLKDAGFSKVEFLSHYRFNVICIKATKY